jgi:hypothetical protein
MKLEPSMRFHPTALKRALLLVLLVGSALTRTWGQATDANGNVVSPIVFQGPNAITTTLVDPATLSRSDSGGGSSDNTQWLKVEFRYAVKPKGPVPFLDSVEFRVWVEGRDLYAPEATTAEGIAVALTGSVTYINLAPTNDGYGVFYIHPSTMNRYSTKAGASDFNEKFNIHIEAYVNGTKVDLFDKNKEQDPNWFSSLKVIPGLVYRHDQCPFMIADTSRYPQIKPSTAGQ